MAGADRVVALAPRARAREDVAMPTREDGRQAPR
jgi:hypothetical protein